MGLFFFSLRPILTDAGDSCLDRVPDLQEPNAKRVRLGESIDPSQFQTADGNPPGWLLDTKGGAGLCSRPSAPGSAFD